MNKPSSIPWWSSFGFGKREPAADTDYADMGTAFGLDASLSSLPADDEAAGRNEGGRPPKTGAGRKTSG